MKTANNIPALREAVIQQLHVPREQVDLRLITARFTNYWVSRRRVRQVPFHLTVLINGHDATSSLNIEMLFDQVSTHFKRSGGAEGLQMTASSASVVFRGLVHPGGMMTHAPGPGGLPGGYPVRVDASGITLALPEGISREAAIDLNKAGLLLDGIEHIEQDGTVYFTEESMRIYQKLFHYSCRRMPLAEVDLWAQELQAKYQEATSGYDRI